MYKATNIDTDKVLDEINYLFKQAELNHGRIMKEEQVRYEQELEDLRRFEKMFYCSNYEKNESTEVSNQVDAEKITEK